jgi:chemotaxis-related protein WspD
MSELVAVDDCWNRIGVSGDRSCPELAEHVHCRNCPVFARAARSFFQRRAPDGYLEEWAAFLAETPVDESTRQAGLLLFRLGAEWLALGIGFVAEVTTPRPVHRVPHRTNAVFSGLVNLRGQLQLCVSLPGLLHIEPSDPVEAPPANPRLVVIGHAGETWAFPAEEVAGVFEVPPSAIAKVPFSRGVFAWGEGRSVDVLDEPRVFEALRSLGS